VELTVAQFVEPLLYGHHTGLSPVAVVTSAIFWTWIWGPIGLLVSTPLTLCLVVLGRHVQRLEFLEVMLGDQPALTPVQSLYQRLLAGDADEAREQAEVTLKEQPLAAWYDEVVVGALRAAAEDVDSGILRGGRLARFRETIRDVVEDLESWKDRADADEVLPAPDPRWQAEGAVLCIAGRGPLDEAAAQMFTQLLRRQGFGVRLVPFSAASRGRIATLDAGGVLLACILYLEVSERPAHLRYLLERLRQRVAAAPVLVGLWSANDPALLDHARSPQLQGDYCAASLRAALAQCVEASRVRAVEKAPAAAA
jgi:hypothetical protein